MELPAHLDERTTRLADAGDGARVVYWMRTAVRGHENPALDVALAVAKARDLPLLVYHAVSERHPYANDRHHTFILQGAIDVAAELRARGIPYALHVERPGHRGPHLRSLAESAALVVTEDMPVEPLMGWTRRVANAGPVWIVDTACVVPMPLVGRPHTRAYAYRQASQPLRAGRLERVWPEQTWTGSSELPDLPFEAVDPSSLDIPALVATCDIDHTIGPVPHTRGGSRAGYARWERFRQRGLKSYSARRNNAADATGVSRMSAWLHYGHVSPLRIAREVAETPGKGADKYLDELLVWRELAYTWCRFSRDHDSLDSLPQWARATLRRHAGDPRPELHDLETLSRARTGDDLWDAAQRSLLAHGELHNNVRMTWGKAVPFWTADPATALERLIDLNHRYALDGRDPASYGGILWCLGGFDRPFKPERPVLGEVRPRPTSHHARRLDLERYTTHVRRPLRADPPHTLVIGAGLAGSLAARTLADHGYAVTVVDKGRGPGGRLSTRRRDADRYDHGAPCFTARDPHIARLVASWAERGVIAPWDVRFGTWDDGWTLQEPGTTRWVGVPGMNAVVRHLQADLDVQFGARVTALTHDGSWQATLEDGTQLTADAVVLAVPSPQARALLDGVSDLAEQLAATRVAPCWTVMLRLDHPLDLPVDSAVLRGRPLAWIGRDSSKPGRPPGERWVLHGSAEWSTEHLEDEREQVIEALLADLRELAGDLVLRDATAHRWRYAKVTHPCGPGFDARGLTIAGDGTTGGKVEAALQSGAWAAGRLLGHFAATAPADQPPATPTPDKGQLGLFGA